MSFLSDILAAQRGPSGSSDELEARAAAAPGPRDFRGALAADGPSLIGEIKRASPSRGDLNPTLDPASIAAAYERGGARALSVLTESDFFKGSPDDLGAARAATALPVLWKGFVLEPATVTDARGHGADAVLVIVRILDDPTLRAVMDEIMRWRMTALVETFDEADIARAVDAGADVIGVNHRDLETFEEDVTATERLRRRIPPAALAVAESAIATADDVRRVQALGYDAVLVGEALVTASDPAAAAAALLG